MNYPDAEHTGYRDFVMLSFCQRRHYVYAAKNEHFKGVTQYRTIRLSACCCGMESPFIFIEIHIRQRRIRKLFIIGFHPLFQSLFKRGNIVELTSRDKFLLQDSNPPLRIRISFRIAATGKYLFNVEFETDVRLFA